MEQIAERRLIAIFVPPHAQLLDLSGPLDAFQEANRQSGGRAAYEVRVIAAACGRAIEAGGVMILAGGAIDEDIPDIDTLLVAGSIDHRVPLRQEAVQRWLAHHCRLARRCGAIGTGAFLLGAAGLLDGRRVTTHWQHTAELAQYCPKATVLADHVFAQDGALYSSAGVTAGLDLALRLIEEDHGRELARKVARRLVASLQNAGRQAQFGAHLAQQTVDEERIRAVQRWIHDHPALDLTLKALAGHAAMGVRHFTRLFRRETGMTPAAYVELVRVEAARRMVAESVLPLDHVALRCGFANSTIMCRAFRRRTGATPSDFRTRNNTAAVAARLHG